MASLLSSGKQFLLKTNILQDPLAVVQTGLRMTSKPLTKHRPKTRMIVTGTCVKCISITIFDGMHESHNHFLK